MTRRCSCRRHTAVIIAYCINQSAPPELYAARLSLILWFFSLYQLLKELLDLWAECLISSLLAGRCAPAASLNLGSSLHLLRA